jgi:hypothetical protein
MATLPKNCYNTKLKLLNIAVAIKTQQIFVHECNKCKDANFVLFHFGITLGSEQENRGIILLQMQKVHPLQIFISYR